MLAIAFLRRLSATILVAPLVLSSCQTAESDEEGDGSKSCIEDPADHPYCSNIPSAYCETYVDCCNAAGFAATLAACERWMRISCLTFLEEAKVQGWCMDASKNAECDASFPHQVSSCRFLGLDTPARSEANQVCGDVWVGERERGESCADSRDCARQPGRSTFCDTYDPATGTADVGVCRSDPTVGPGETCGYPQGLDGPYFACEWPNGCLTSDTCGRPGERGAACSSLVDCISYVCTDGVCAGSEGDPCDTDNDCAPFLSCVEGVCVADAVASPEFCAFET
jgi:hypothetical protein